MSLQIKSLQEYKDTYHKSISDPDAFWGEVANHFTWKKKWDRVSNWSFNPLDIKWFEGGQLNITENCLDRHLAESGDKIALLWEPNDPSQPTSARALELSIA